MKKLLIVVILAVLLATFVCAATAQTVEEQINAIACQNDKVLDAKSIVYDKACVVAIKTERFVTRREYEDYRNDLINQIKSKFEIDCVIVTRNPKVMCQIDKLNELNETERDKAIQELIEKILSRYIQPRDKVIMPKKVF